MKHIFIYNPMAGKDSTAAVAALKEKMKEYDGKLDYEFYDTKAAGDATVYVRKRCEETQEELRFYACGGDGTANEVLHGLVGCPNASMTCYPCGSGNDYVKYYGGAAKFLDIDALIAGTEKAVDIMKVDDRYALNVINFGFDTVVAETMIKVKHKKIIGGKHAYTTGIMKALLTAMKTKGEVFVDGEKLNEGKMLLCTVANGKYVGGSFCCAPRSVNDDGQQRPENAVAAVGTAHVLRTDGQMAALVSDQVFVVRGQKRKRSAAESAGSAIPVAEKDEPIPTFLDKLVADGVYSPPAVADIQAAPPYKIFQGGGAMALEIAACQFGQGLLFGDRCHLRKLFCSKRIGRLLRVQVPAAKQAGILGQADVVGKPVLIHHDSLVPEGRRAYTSYPYRCRGRWGR